MEEWALKDPEAYSDYCQIFMGGGIGGFSPTT